ncbi:MAG: glycosyltransferase family 2 protein [Chitinophagales bacterium]
MKIVALVPAYNEEKRIKETLAAIQTIAQIDDILVINDGSTDRTSKIAQACGARVLELEGNVGKGEALNRGARAVEADIVLLLDADLGSSAAQGDKLLVPLLSNQADLTIARFPPARKKGGFGLVKGLATRAIAREGLRVESPLSGQRAMSKKVLDDVLPFHSGYGIEVGMTIRALRKGYRLMEVPVEMTHAETGRDLKGFLHRGRQYRDVLRVIIAEGRRRKS